jgi:hypothetical protein
MISLGLLRYFSWRIRVTYLKNSRNSRHWMKINMVDISSVWDLIMEDSMWINYLKNTLINKVSLGIMFLIPLNRVVYQREIIRLSSKSIDAFCKPKIHRLSFGLKLFIVPTISLIVFWLELSILLLHSRDGVERIPQWSDSEYSYVFPRTIFWMIAGRN